MRNTLADLNNYLFEQIERLQDDELTEEELRREISRSDAIQNVAKTIIANGELAFRVKKHLDDFGDGEDVDLPMIGLVYRNGEH